MKSISLIALIGYIFNMYYLIVDPEIRPYNWMYQTGVVIFPLGVVTGYVYMIDRTDLLRPETYNIDVKEVLHGSKDSNTSSGGL